jgi:hypothetical protein
VVVAVAAVVVVVVVIIVVVSPATLCLKHKDNSGTHGKGNVRS